MIMGFMNQCSVHVRPRGGTVKFPSALTCQSFCGSAEKTSLFATVTCRMIFLHRSQP